ncbi:nuclease [Virgibacillus halodenitrificans]|uniref:Nuclease n=1 Tax=Virgibacillus halodenitrificans TaxID=1482 RepID=A0AAC9IZB4_VIRHA|nr:nuclease-related domain-containing protein [Virgibacillus halodenitrificans]APC47883.1 nuclease [Virgibacillus halodenitrificans]
MIHKRRDKPIGLRMLELLSKRMSIDSKTMQQYVSLKKGYEGELFFDTFINELKEECIILNDLLLEVNHTVFQIDSLLITQEKIQLYEVKNFGGDFYYEEDKLFTRNQREIVNPLHQVGRSNSLFSQLLIKLQIKMPIEAFVVFVNPDFTLYQAPIGKPIIFPGQLKRHMSNLSNTHSRLTNYHKNIAEQLVERHIAEPLYPHVLHYDYQLLRKGITCQKCDSFSITVERKYCSCNLCNHKELVSLAVLRSVEEFTTLFPKEKITTNIIHDWCKIVTCKKRISRYLESNFQKEGVRQWTFYK